MPAVNADVELANLRNHPSNIIHSTNALYRRQQFADSEMSLLPSVSLSKLKLSNILGKGAFGEVYEGLMTSSSGVETRVAIKTLRREHSKHDKEEFLKEAQLMSNFKHDHILRMIGVCIETDPPYIIMELMEGGDLLSFLRASREHSTGEMSDYPNLRVI